MERAKFIMRMIMFGITNAAKPSISIPERTIKLVKKKCYHDIFGLTYENSNSGGKKLLVEYIQCVPKNGGQFLPLHIGLCFNASKVIVAFLIYFDGCLDKY